MSSLFGNLSIAVKALMTQQAAIQTTSNNIANVNTPGYTRQRAIVQEDTPVVIGTLLFGTGASVGKVESIRDKVPLRIQPLSNPADPQRDQSKPNRKLKPKPQQKQDGDQSADDLNDSNDSGEELSEQEKHQFDTLA